MIQYSVDKVDSGILRYQE